MTINKWKLFDGQFCFFKISSICFAINFFLYWFVYEYKNVLAVCVCVAVVIRLSAVPAETKSRISTNRIRSAFNDQECGTTACTIQTELSVFGFGSNTRIHKSIKSKNQSKDSKLVINFLYGKNEHLEEENNQIDKLTNLLNIPQPSH